LRQVAHVIDNDHDRQSRRDALSAFIASGIADYRTLWTDKWRQVARLGG
jgi:hypothetical protein